MDILLAKTPKDDVRDHVLPMVCKALETPDVQLQVQLCQSWDSFWCLYLRKSYMYCLSEPKQLICFILLGDWALSEQSLE